MQANSQHSGQLQNLHGQGATPGGGMSQNFYQLCLPPRAASPLYSGQTATGNYLTFSTHSTLQPATSNQNLTSSVQATRGTQLAQENKHNPNHEVLTGKQDSQIILWNMPSNCQIFLPVNNINLQGVSNNNGPNMSHCAFNSTNGLYMQQQTTSSAVAPNNFQQFNTSLSEARINVNTSNLHSRQHYANAPTNLPKNSSKTRTSLPSDLKYCPPTENARHAQSSLVGGLYQLLFAEKSNNANVQTYYTCVQNLQQNNTAQKAVAVVTPLSPIGTASVNVSDNSNVKMNARPVQETVHHQPNIPSQTGEPINPTSKHQRPKSAEPRLNDGLCNLVGARSPVLVDESTSQSCHTSSPQLESVVAEQNKAVPTQMQDEPSEKTNQNCTTTDKKTLDTVPFTEWSIDRLVTLMVVIQHMEDGNQNNIRKTDPGREILRLYWNGDCSKFSEAVDSGIYQSIMEEVYVHSTMNEPVILRQVLNDARSKVIENFHVLKHNEEPPKMTYKSSWLNLNENVDDIDKECGYSWFYRSLQNVPEHEAPSKLQEATEKPSLIRCELPLEVENKVPADKPTSNNESLCENMPVSFNGQSPPVTDISCSPKYDYQVTGLTNNQPTITSSLEATVVADMNKQGVPNGTSSSDYQFAAKCVVSAKSTSQSDYTNSPKPVHVVAEEQEIVLSSQMEVGSSEKMLSNDCVIFDENVRCETMLKPSREIPVHMNEVETDQMDTPTKRNVLPHEMARQCFANGMKDHNSAAFPDKHKASLLNTPQVLDTISMEEQIRRQMLEGKANNSASMVLALLSACYKSSLDEQNQMTDKVQQEEQMSSEDGSREQSPVPLNAQSPPVIDNFSPTLYEQQTNCQPNTVNPLKGMTNLVRTLEKRNASLRKYQKFIEKHGGLKKKHKSSSTTSKLVNSFGNTVRAKSPILIDDSSSQSDCTIDTPMLSPVVDPKPCLSVQSNEENIVEMDTSSSVKLDVLTQEMAKQCFAEDEDIAATPKSPTLRLDDPVCNRANDKLDCASPPKLYPVLAGPSQARNESDEEMPEIDCVLSNETLRCETNPSQELPVNMNEEDVEMYASASIKINVLTQEVAKQCFAGQLVQTDGSVSPVDYASPPMLHPVLAEPSRVQLDEEMPEIDCVLTDKRCDTDPKPGQELPVEMNEEEIVKLDTSACMMINVLPHDLAMQCFADQMMEDEDIAAPPEMIRKACLWNSPQDAVSTKEQTNMGRLEGTDESTSPSSCASPPKLDPVIAEPSQMQNKSNEEMPEIDCMLSDESVRSETDLKPTQELCVNMNEEMTEKIGGLDSIKINVLSHEMAELWFAGEPEDKDLQKDLAVRTSTEDQVKAEVLELKSEKEVLLEDVKPEERNGDGKLESYCCLAKWFQSLEFGNGSLCMCQIKAEMREEEIKIEAHSTSLEVQTTDSPGECEQVEMEDAALERTDDSEVTDDSEDEYPLLHDPTKDKSKIVKDPSSSEEASKEETETSEQERNESPTKCATNVTPMNETEQDTPASDLKTNTVCLALYGSSSGKRNKLKLTKRRKEKVSCEEPPKTLQVTISSYQKIKDNSGSMKRKSVEAEDEDAMDRKDRIQGASMQNLALRKTLPLDPFCGLNKTGLSSTSVRKPLSLSGTVKSDVRLSEGNKRKRQHKQTTQQMSMNKFIIRAKTVPSKLLHSPEDVKKSKYELGNPALMPLDESPALEFKVLPESFNFEDGAEPNSVQADTSQSTQNGMSGSEEEAKKMKTSHAPTQGVWSFSPLKKKHTQPIQAADVSGSCSLFQEFKKKYQKKKDNASKQSLNSSEKA